MSGEELREGVPMTATQLHAFVLQADPDVQLAFFQAAVRYRETVGQCLMQDHAGAVHYAMHHACKPRRQPRNRGRRRQVIQQGRKP